MTYYDTIIRYYFSYYFSYYDTWDYYFSYYFSIMTHYFSLFFLLFSIMTGCLQQDNGTVQTAIFGPCTEKWLISVCEGSKFTWSNWKARKQNGKQPDGVFLNYYTHYFYNYTDYFSRLIRIASAVSMSFALLLCVPLSNHYYVCYTKLRERQASYNSVWNPNTVLLFYYYFSLYHYYFNYF